jgi:hypothetical protein
VSNHPMFEPRALGVRTFTVAPPGAERPDAYADLAAAVDAAVQLRLTEPDVQIRIEISAGDHYLDAPVRIGPLLSGQAGAPTVITGAGGSDAASGSATRLLAGRRIRPSWSAPSDDGIVSAHVEGPAVDQLYVDGRRQVRARYLNIATSMRAFDAVAADALDPERTRSWANPEGAILHAKHAHRWGDVFTPVLGRDPQGAPLLGEATANNRPMGPHLRERYVENVLEELDAPGEWFLDRDSTLHYRPDEGVSILDSTFQVSGAMRVVEIIGSAQDPVHDLLVENLAVGHAGMSFAVATEPLLRSDWLIAREAAIVITGGADVTVLRCGIADSGGHGVLLDGFNRRVVVRGCHLHDLGGSGVNVFGWSSAVRSPMFTYGTTIAVEDLDRQPGPLSDDFAESCVVDDNLIHDIGTVQKSVAGISLSMCTRITVAHNTIYRVPRAGINICDGTWGAHVVEHNDVFDTVLESADHGAFNSWGRDRFWDADPDVLERRVSSAPDLVDVDSNGPTELRHNRFHCEHGWDVDLDDGSSHYRVHHNLMMAGGLKLREGYDRWAWNNILVNCGVHLHVWPFESRDRVERNILGAGHHPVRFVHRGDSINHNLFWGADQLEDAHRLGLDARSGYGDAQFVDPAAGDYTVADDSPALAVGFENFPMDGFGVRSWELRALAEPAPTPVQTLGVVREAEVAVDVPELGLVVKTITSTAEVSAHGLGHVGGVAVLGRSPDAAHNLLVDDVILAFAADEYDDEQQVVDAEHLLMLLRSRAWHDVHGLLVWRNQQLLLTTVRSS